MKKKKLESNKGVKHKVHDENLVTFSLLSLKRNQQRSTNSNVTASGNLSEGFRQTIETCWRP